MAALLVAELATRLRIAGRGDRRRGPLYRGGPPGTGDLGSDSASVRPPSSAEGTQIAMLPIGPNGASGFDSRSPGAGASLDFMQLGLLGHPPARRGFTPLMLQIEPSIVWVRIIMYIKNMSIDTEMLGAGSASACRCPQRLNVCRSYLRFEI